VNKFFAFFNIQTHTRENGGKKCEQLPQINPFLNTLFPYWIEKWFTEKKTAIRYIRLQKNLPLSVPDSCSSDIMLGMAHHRRQKSPAFNQSMKLAINK